MGPAGVLRGGRLAAKLFPVTGRTERMGMESILPSPGINPRETPLCLHVLQD
jgi:hypothetical protein